MLVVQGWVGGCHKRKCNRENLGKEAFESTFGNALTQHFNTAVLLISHEGEYSVRSRQMPNSSRGCAAVS